MKMNSSSPRYLYRKPALCLWLAAVLILLACGALGTGTAPGPAGTGAVSPSPSPSPKPTGSPTPAGTPTLGARSGWRTSRIAFASNRTGHFQIYLVKPDGSELTQLTDSEGDNLSPSWSPDAQHLAFTSTRDGNPEIYSMNADGTQQKNLTRLPTNERAPIWLPDDKIAFISDNKGLERIIVMNADGTQVQSLRYTSINSNSRMFCLTWLSEGYLSFTVEEDGERKVRVVDTSTGETGTPARLNGAHDRSCPLIPALVTDSWAVFVSNRDGHDEIYKYNTQSDADVQLTKDSTSSLGPSRSSDEAWITFYSKRTGNWELYVMDNDGKNQWDITDDPGDDVQPAWEPY